MDRTAKSALLNRLDSLIGDSHQVENKPPYSSELVQWRMTSLQLLEDLFGPAHRFYLNFASLTFSPQRLILDPDELQPGEPVQSSIDKQRDRASHQDVLRARGILNAARNHLFEHDLTEVYRAVPKSQEPSQVLQLLDLLEHKLRLAFRDAPTSELEVQEKLEVLLHGFGLPFSREAETIEFGGKLYKPDFVIPQLQMALEVKFSNRPSRPKELPAEISDDARAYRTKFPNLLFVIYDCGMIRDARALVDSYSDCARVIIVKH